MLLNNRIIFKDGLALRDLSVKLNNFRSGTEILDASLGESVYIGSELPFNHRHIEVSVPNAIACEISVDIWTGSDWESAVDVIDQTSVGGNALAQSGIISWAPDQDGKFWGKEDSTEDIPELSTLKIYNLYWVRLTFSATITPTTALKFMGWKFSSDEKLAVYYPQLGRSDVKTQYEAGKTDWNDQHIAASEVIVKEMIKKRMTFSGNQILQWDQFEEPSIHYVAAMIFRAFGDDYADNFEQSINDYNSALDKVMAYNIDRDADGRLDESERFGSAGIFRR